VVSCLRKLFKRYRAVSNRKKQYKPNSTSEALTLNKDKSEKIIESRTRITVRKENSERQRMQDTCGAGIDLGMYITAYFPRPQRVGRGLATHCIYLPVFPTDGIRGKVGGVCETWRKIQEGCFGAPENSLVPKLPDELKRGTENPKTTGKGRV